MTTTMKYSMNIVQLEKEEERTIKTIYKELDEGDRVTITTKPKKILEQEI
jgi:hypothetical protein